MKRSFLNPALMTGLVFFTGLMPLTFVFSQNETRLLLDTPARPVVWAVQAVVLLLLLFRKPEIGRKQSMGLAILCLLVPFVFTFGPNGLSFVIFDNYVSACLSWGIAGILSKPLFIRNNIKKSGS